MQKYNKRNRNNNNNGYDIKATIVRKWFGTWFSHDRHTCPFLILISRFKTDYLRQDHDRCWLLVVCYDCMPAWLLASFFLFLIVVVLYQSLRYMLYVCMVVMVFYSMARHVMVFWFLSDYCYNCCCVCCYYRRCCYYCYCWVAA